jgi:hypothetical protein
VRDSKINSALHEFTITEKGIVIASDSATAENILAEAAGQGWPWAATLPGSGRYGEG